MPLFSPVTVWWLQTRNHTNPVLPPASMNKRTTVHVSPNGDCCRVLQHDLGWALKGRVCGYKWLYLWVYLVTSVHLIVFVPLVSHREWHYTSLAIDTFTVDIKVFFFLVRIQNVTQQTSNEVRNRVFCESHIKKEYRIICMLLHISIYACIYVFTYYMQKWTPCSYIQTHPQITHYLFLDSFVMNTKSFLS